MISRFDLNWRKPILFLLMRSVGSLIPHELKLLRSIEYEPKTIRDLQQRRLVKLLQHAWENTEYYRDVLSDVGVVINGKVNLDRFNNIPLLTKSIIRSNGERLRAKNLSPIRKPYNNRTGGSTGEPVSFWQDSHYWDINVATKLYHFAMNGKNMGELEFKLWGSDRDVVFDSTGWTTKLKNFLYNRKVIASNRLTYQDMHSIVKTINTLKPKSIWGYTDTFYTIAKFINQNEINLHPPIAVFGGATTLFPHMTQAIEKAFHAPLVNMYGSREMGDIACECPKKAGLHISSHSHLVEIVDGMGKSVVEQDGEMVVTSLHNFAMPFLRYRIGDRGRLTAKKCPCKRGFPLLETVHGRGMESFLTKEGDIVSPVYLITKLSATFNERIVKKFQLIQDDYCHISLKIVLDSSVNRQQALINLEQASAEIKSMMGENCEISHKFVEDIPATKSGKYQYTISKVSSGVIT